MKIGRDEMRGRRNRQIEAELQRTLDEGGNVWAIGDVHGYADTLLALLDSLNLSSRDKSGSIRRPSRQRTKVL